MKQLLVVIVFFAVLVSVYHPSRAAVPAQPASIIVARPDLAVVEPVKPDVSAKAYVVIDVTTGDTILQHNASQVLPIASITKLFTAAALTSYDEEITITATDVAAEGRAGKLEVGQVYRARELLFPLLLESSNDAAAALARRLDTISLDTVPLADASGLSSQNQASALQVAVAVRNLYHTQPYLFDITQLEQYIGTYTGWVNNSPLYQFSGYRGGKHGYTEAAGKTAAAIFAESSLDDRELVYVVLGSRDVKSDVQALRSTVEHSVRLQ